LLTGYALIPATGLAASMHLTGSANILVGLLALALSRTESTAPEPVPVPVPVCVPVRVTRHPFRRTLLLATCATGAAAFLYETAWTRLLALTLGASTYAFTIMLAA